MNTNDIIGEYKDYLEKLPKGCLIIADLLREDKLTDALSSVQDFTEGVIWLSKVSEMLKEESFDFDLDIRKIQEYLIEVNEGLTKQDYVIVADMFEYEIAPFFEAIVAQKKNVQ